MTAYERTKAGKKNFLRDLVPGKTYYSITELVQPWGNEPAYETWVFKKSRLWVGVCGHMSAEAVLANYGPLYDTQPVGMRGVNDRSGAGYNPHDNNGRGYEMHQRALAGRRRAGAR
ncbi:hypothetical protein [Streptomyces sp. SAJ15]|uniref:hypothetical protein n=1 Tax=Streptomyces sp. SAJ15 TaxID=2011095 RepID=UPI00118550D1|nr:hypothetical protein [Streptomyces sp. SAJ15]TVL89772.1 hypothetical protein CD790_25585 [Streptomyces sp. SAJ15]